MQAYALRTCRLALDSNAIRVAAEGRNVLFDPLHRKALVQEAGVGAALGEDLGCLQEAPDAEAVVHRHCDHGAVEDLRAAHNAAQIILRVGGTACIEAAAVDPDQDWKGGGGWGMWADD